MRVRVLFPGDLDTSAAPPADLYLDSRLGDDLFDGSSPVPMTGGVGPKRTDAGLPVTLNAGQVIACRNGGLYGPPAFPGGDLEPPREINFQGAPGNPAVLRSWGIGPRAAMVGSAPARSFWGPVTEGLGNSYLIANGEQADTLPAWCDLFNMPAEGAESYCPAYWNPTISDNLEQISRRDWYRPLEGAEGAYVPTSRQPGFGNTTGSAALVRDPNFELSFSADEGSFTVTYYWRHPKIAEFFGDTAGPVGCRLAGQGDPSNATYWTYISGYDYANSELIFVFPRNSSRVRLDGYLMLVGVPQAIRQPGQFGYRRNGESVSPTYWLVKAPWMGGGRRHSVRQAALRIRGQHFELRGFSFRQAVGNDSSPGRAIGISGNVQSGLVEDGEITWFHSNNGRAINTTSDAFSVENLTIRNVTFDSMPCAGGVTFAGMKNSTLDGLRFFEVGGTCISQNTSDPTPDNQVIRNCESAHVATVHGNGVSLYANSSYVLEENCLHVDRVLPWTHQGTLTNTNPPQARTRRNSILMMARGISTVPVTARRSGDSFRFGYGGNGCVNDRLWIPRGGRAGMFMGYAGNPGPNPNSLLYQFDDSVTKRSAIDGVAIGTNRAQAYAGGAPALFRDVLTTRVGSIPQTPAQWAGNGATVVRCAHVELPAFAGVLRVEEWEYMSRRDDFETSLAYEAFQLGPDRLDWQIPVYNPDLIVGAPVPLRLSREWFNAKQQPGTSLAMFFRARPGSTVVLDPDYGDGADLLLDLGQLVILERFARTVRFRLIETTLQDAVLATDFEMECRR